MIIGLPFRSIVIENKKKKFVNQSYLNYLKKYDLVPCFLDEANFNLFKKICDAFLIPGGFDIDPILYNQENTNSINVDKEIDNLDFNILDYAVKNSIPIFGICRGLQVMNVYFNGTLYQDIDKIHHFNNKAKVLINNSKYFPFFNEKSFIINSFHHQAINKLGQDLIKSGISDNIIEIIEHKKYPLIGIQFHIELLESEEINKIFLVFIELIKKYSKNK